MHDLKVTIDNSSGFCFGVVYAIELAEEYLDQYGKLYCLGDIVHNDQEVERLTAKGLRIIDHEELKQLKGERVLLRAHGEPPETYKTGIENDLELIDASCPVVLKLQYRVREAVKKDSESPVLIYGKHGHAEVKGLLGQANGNTLVFQSLEELKKKLDNFDALPPSVWLFSQTTKDTTRFYEIRKYLESSGIEVQFNDTICRQVSNRDKELRDFVQNFDKVVFVSGTKSSNGKVLYQVCKNYNPSSYFVSGKQDIVEDWFDKNDRVGICGATSTPQWLMEDLKGYLETI